VSRTFIMLAVLAVLAPVALADVPKGLSAALESYEKGATAAREEFARDIDKVIDTVRKSKADAALVDKRLKELKEQKTRYEEKGELPTHDLLLPAAVEYLDRLNKARAEWNRLFKKETDEAKKAKDDARLADLVKLRASLDKQFGGRDHLTAKSQWDGLRYGEEDAVGVHLSVTKVDENTFQGRYVQHPGGVGKIVMDVEGVLDGNAIEFATTKVIEGGKRTFKFTGYVIEDRLVLRLTGTVGPKATPVTSLIDMRKK
jgi:phosphoglycolate phosphatase-like HAD superfamily hydrolase